MTVLDLVLIVFSTIFTFITYKGYKKSKIEDIWEYALGRGFGNWMWFALKGMLTISSLLYFLINRIDWDFLNYKIL